MARFPGWAGAVVPRVYPPPGAMVRYDQPGPGGYVLRVRPPLAIHEISSPGRLVRTSPTRKRCASVFGTDAHGSAESSARPGKASAWRDRNFFPGRLAWTPPTRKRCASAFGTDAHGSADSSARSGKAYPFFLANFFPRPVGPDPADPQTVRTSL